MFFDFSKLMKCSETRHKQLQEEKKIDDKLKSCECEVVKEYLFAYREMNRQMSDTLYQASILDTPHIFVEHIDKIEDHFNKINNMKDICKELPELVKEMN